MKPAVIAKLANQCSFLYDEALKMLHTDIAKYVLPKVTVFTHC